MSEKNKLQTGAEASAIPLAPPVLDPVDTNLQTRKLEYGWYAALFVIAAFLIIILIYLLFYWLKNTDTKISADEAIKFIGILLVLVASIMSVVASFRTANKQIEAANENLGKQQIFQSNQRKLQDHSQRLLTHGQQLFQQQLNDAQERHKETLEGIMQQNRAALEGLKGEINKDVEAIKSYLSGKTKAYENLNLAASQFYYALAEMQYGEFNENLVREAQTAIFKNSAYIYHISEENKKLWYAFVQIGGTIIRKIETREPLAPEERVSFDEMRKKKISGIKRIWQEEGREFGKIYAEFLKASNDEVESLNSPPEKVASKQLSPPLSVETDETPDKKAD